MPDAVLTKDRQTTVEFDTGPQNLLCFPTYYGTRLAGQMSPSRQAGVEETRDVVLVPGVNAWVLRTFSGMLGAVTRDPSYASSLIEPTDANLAPSVESFRMHAAADDLPGVNTTTPVTSFPAYVKSPPAGSSWDVTVPLPYPTPSAPLPNDADIDPVFTTKVTHPPNCGFTFIFTVPQADFGLGGFLMFGFGGPTDTDPLAPGEEKRGQFLMRLLGGGQGDLSELVNNPNPESGGWQKRQEFTWGDPLLVRGSGGVYLVTVQPLGREHIIIRTGMSDVLGVQGFTLPITVPTRSKLQHAHWRNVRAVTGYDKLNWSTGPGEAHIFVKRELRTLFTLARLKYPTAGTLVDMPFTLPWPKIPAGTEMFLTVNKEEVPGTSVTARMFNASTHVEMEANEDGRFLTAEDQGQYYVQFDFTSDGDQTPLLYGYSVDVNGFRETRATTPTTGGNLREVSITGADLDPAQATASCMIKDVKAELGTLLSQRAGMPCRIKTTDHGISVVVHEGLLLEARGKRRGDGNRIGAGGAGGLRVYPSQNWKDYQCKFSGMWARVQRQVNLNLEDFRQDATTEPINGRLPPWKITRIIQYLLLKIGYQESELDIPDLDVRMWSTDMGDLTMQPTVSFAEFIQHLAKDYLASVLLWDANAGSNGMWRLIPNPQPPFAPIATFLAEPDTPGKLTTHPNSYADNETFIIRDSFETVVYPPECNYVLVTGTGQLLADGTPTQVMARIYNPLSFNWDPARPTADENHPDHLGDFVPVLLIDPRIRTKEEAAYLARRIYDRAAHAEKWFAFSAPALFVTVAGDTHLSGKRRPLQINDVVTVLGQTALIRSAAYGWKRDTMQTMQLQGKFIT